MAIETREDEAQGRPYSHSLFGRILDWPVLRNVLDSVFAEGSEQDLYSRQTSAFNRELAIAGSVAEVIDHFGYQ